MTVWSWNRRHEVSINAVSLGLNGCNLDDCEHQVDETPDAVTITVTARGGPKGDDCSDGLTVQLAEPLGASELLDGATGEPVPMKP